jgi:hypothetical protein
VYNALFIPYAAHFWHLRPARVEPRRRRLPVVIFGPPGMPLPRLSDLATAALKAAPRSALQFIVEICCLPLALNIQGTWGKVCKMIFRLSKRLPKGFGIPRMVLII